MKISDTYSNIDEVWEDTLINTLKLFITLLQSFKVKMEVTGKVLVLVLLLALTVCATAKNLKNATRVLLADEKVNNYENIHTAAVQMFVCLSVCSVSGWVSPWLLLASRPG